MSLHLQRAWRLRAGGAALAGIGAIALSIWYLGAVLPADQTLHLASAPDLIFAALAAGTLVAVAAWHAFAACRERVRAGQRAAVIAGNADAMPRARHSYDWLGGDPASGIPVVVQWRADRFDRLLMGAFFFLVFGVFEIIIAVLFVTIIVALATHHLAVLAGLATAQGHATPGSAPGLPLLVGVCLGIQPVAIVLLRSSWNSIFRHFRLEANEEGLRWIGSWGRERLIRWADARLFEVVEVRRLDGETRTTRRINRYRLYTSDLVIAWDNDSDFLNRDARRSLGQLLADVGRHTRLALRTPSGSLDRSGRQPALQWQFVRAAGVAVFWALYSAALLGVVIVVPPTSATWLNVVIAISLFVSVGVVAWIVGYYWFTAVALRRRNSAELAARHGGRQRTVPFPSYTAVIGAQERAAWQGITTGGGQRYLWLFRIFALVALTTLAADALPGISVIGYHGGWPGSRTPLVPTGPATVVAYLLMLHGFVGIIALPVVVAVLGFLALRALKRRMSHL